MSIIKEIKKILEKYYINYKPNLYKNVETIEQFNRVWGREHGGYISKEMLEEIKKLDKGIKKENRPIPQIKTVQLNGKNVKAIWIPECPSNDPQFWKKYAEVGYKLVLDHFKEVDTITIDLRNNMGGKPGPMAAALSPIFGLSKRNVLTFLTTKKGIEVEIKRTKDGEYVDKYNAPIKGTDKTLENIKKINVLFDGTTNSAGEHLVIALKSIGDQFKVKTYSTGHMWTQGNTTSIRDFKLSDGTSIEVPIGYMTDAFGKAYKRGIKAKYEL